MKWIISNHKEEKIEKSYQKEIAELVSPKIKLIICPNDTQLSDFKEVTYDLGSQDVNYFYTVEELKKMSVKYTIVGHSDKRKQYNETTNDINKKIKVLLKANICPILCIGENEEKELNIKKLLDNELEECLKNIETSNIIIAYEPVWAIGSGKIPNINELIEIVEYIRQKTIKLIGVNPIIVYGGSVNENTMKLLKEVPGLDGYLIGSASLDTNKLKELIEVIE